MKSMFLVVLTAILLFRCGGTSIITDESGLESPKLLKSGKLIYPPEAIAQYAEGVVQFYLLIDTTGAVKRIEVVELSGSGYLDDSALEYSKTLVFAPIIVNGIPVEKWVKWKVAYELENTSYKKETISLLIYTKASGYKHASIAAGVKALNLIAEENRIDLEVTEDSTYFTDSNLAGFDVVMFLNTSGNILDDTGERAFQNFIRNGGGFVGIHAAADTEKDWEWYGDLVGAVFESHPEIQKASIIVNDPNHPSTRHLKPIWEWTDEWYNWKSEPGPKCHILLTVDESTYQGGKHEGFHPVAWYQNFEGGRSWYTALGHSSEYFLDSDFIKHILGGILWASVQTK